MGVKLLRISSVSAELHNIAVFLASSEQLGLFYPLIADDPARKPAKMRVDTFDLFRGPRGDLGKAGNAEFAEQRGKLGAEALDAGEVVAGAGRGDWRGGGGCAGASASAGGRDRRAGFGIGAELNLTSAKLLRLCRPRYP